MLAAQPARCGLPSHERLARVPEVEPRMLICVAEAVAEPAMAAQDLDRTAPLKLSHRICPTGEAVVELRGELDIATAEVAVSYVSDITDRHRGPVTVT